MHNRPTSGLGAGKSVFKYFGARIWVFRPIKKKLHETQPKIILLKLEYWKYAAENGTLNSKFVL